jgi:lon-related putative ATP-dependent protease
MFFRKSRNGAGSTAPDASHDAPHDAPHATNLTANEADTARGDHVAAELTAPLVPAVDHTPLTAADVRRTVAAQGLGFNTTSDLEPISGLIGQERALRAIEFGTLMKAHDYNIFVLGPAASGKRTAVKAYLETLAAKSPTPPDWVYLNDFDNQNRPKALQLPPGRARALQQGMIGAIDELRATLPALFEGDDYQARRRAIEEEYRTIQDGALESLSKKAQAQNIAVLRTPTGFAMAPMHEGRVVKPEIFQQLPDEMRRGVEVKIEALQRELEQVLEAVPKSDKQRRAHLAGLHESMAQAATREALDELKSAFSDLPAVVAHLDATERDMIRNVALFLKSGEDGEELVKQPADTSRDPRYRRYLVNVLVGSDGGAPRAVPTIEELNPTYGNLIGRIDHVAEMGTLMTDFLLIKAGSLHRANGGSLLIDARKMLLSPFTWEALKRTLKAREIRIEQPAETVGMMTTQSLDPEPIPLDVKVILFGDRELYYMLSQSDPDFLGLFKVQADFDDTIARSDDNDRSYARVIASIVATHKLKPVDADGVSRLIEQGARLASDRDKLSIEIGHLSDLVREADFWSGKAGHEITSRSDVARAIAEQIQRADRVRDTAQESIDRNIVMIDTRGSKIGQINGLSVRQIGNFAFGGPTRITARVRAGQGRVTDIEREANLGGPLHSKGVMILWGYLAGRFAQEVPLSLAASLVFEQSYSGVDGDSASSTELYALLSALAEVPINQGVAVTGSVNQWGEVQAIGGVNEKIEGYFDICKSRGLSGDHGVMIPAANVQHLMLREDVVEAVHAGTFRIHPVTTIDQGIEILTGIAAGERDTDPHGTSAFPSGTINARVEARLRQFADRVQKFGTPTAVSNRWGASS